LAEKIAQKSPKNRPKIAQSVAQLIYYKNNAQLFPWKNVAKKLWLLLKFSKNYPKKTIAQ
jgi:hypothetical protein